MSKNDDLVCLTLSISKYKSDKLILLINSEKM